MRLHYLQHIPFEGTAHILDWARSREIQITSTQLYNSQDFPSQNDFDFLVIMGGPMSIHDEKEYEWLVAEKQFIKQAIQNGKKILGICLGAQLIAHVLGATVQKNSCKEIGWYDIEFDQNTLTQLAFSHFPKKLKCLHWHGETFSIPDGALHIAASQACLNQGFVYQDKVYALQFHLETSEDSLKKLVFNCEDELQEGPYIQSKDEIFTQMKNIQNMKPLLFEFLDKIIKS